MEYERNNQSISAALNMEPERNNQSISLNVQDSKGTTNNA
jgi:hypothetical protein